MNRCFFPILLTTVALAFAQDRIPVAVPGAVTVPLDEYNRLTDLAAKAPKKTSAPPVPAAVNAASWQVDVRNDGVTAKLQLDGEVFIKGPAKLPLVTGLAVGDAQQRGRDLPLQIENGTHFAIVNGPGDFTLTLDAGLSLATEPGRAGIELPRVLASTVRLNLSLPGEYTSVNLGAGVVTSLQSNGGRTLLEATLPPGQPVRVYWTTRDAATAPTIRESRFTSEIETLISVRETGLAVAALTTVDVLQGEPDQFKVSIPAGFEVSNVTGSSLESTESQPGFLILKVNNPALRNHEFLISLEKPIEGTKASTPVISFPDSRREKGEIVVEGEGTLEMNATESGGLHRMDLREANSFLRELIRYSPQSAFRYQRQPSVAPALALEWTRFPDSAVLAAIARQATVTTMVTTEGRSLTEVKLTLNNLAQPFLKLGLPTGASIVSADVAGEKVKPVQGADGNRIPLLRPGFRPTGSYVVSFVFLHSGSPFAKKGDAELTLPKMDIPIEYLDWEVFLPERYRTKDFGGDVVEARLLPVVFDGDSNGALSGVLLDASGAAIPNGRVILTRPNGQRTTVQSDSEGRWTFFNVQAGSIAVQAEAQGFSIARYEYRYDPERPDPIRITLQVGAAMEVVAVAPTLETSNSSIAGPGRRAKAKDNEKDDKQAAALADSQASTNVLNLQRRVAGVLPIAIDVPKVGTSYRFARPLVIDEETKVTFAYKSK